MDEWMQEITSDELPESHRKFAEVIGTLPTLKLCDAYGGSMVYIPMNDVVYNVAVRDKEIKRRYLRGTKIRMLATQYGISERTVLKIVEDSRPEQTTFFDDGDDG